MAEEYRRGMGSLGFWGNTPAYNLTELIPDDQHEKQDEFNILLLGQSDARHVLQTLCNLKNNEQELHIYLVESHPVLYARQLLFLHLAFLPLDQMGLHEKVTQFMEIFGNILIRPQTMKTIKKCCESLVRIVTDDESLAIDMPFMDLQDLKFRERDVISEILTYWSKREKHLTAVQMKQLWDGRLRQYHSTRFDSRIALFDWDYQMKIVEKNIEAKIIHVTEYKRWRNGGLAYSEFESDYNQPNVTLFPNQGSPYNGDILIGPFIPYGIKCNNASFFEQANNQYKNKSADLTFHNLQEIFSRLSPRTNEDLPEMLKNVKIHLLPLDTCENLWKKSKFLQKFDIVHCSNFIGHKIKPELTKLLKPSAIVFVEQPRFVWYFREENDKAFEKKLIELADSAGLKLQNSKRDHFLQFKVGINEPQCKDPEPSNENDTQIETETGGGGDS